METGDVNSPVVKPILRAPLLNHTPLAQAKHQEKNQTSNQLVEYMDTDDELPSITYKPPVVRYNRVPSLTYNHTPVAQATQLVENMETNDGIPSITYKPPVVQYNRVPSLTSNHGTVSNLPPPNHGTVSNLHPPFPRQQFSSYNRPIGIEQTLYLCTLCETPTKFSDYHKLGRHVERFHSAFNQDNKGVKRGKGEREGVRPKKLRWE